MNKSLPSTYLYSLLLSAICLVQDTYCEVNFKEKFYQSAQRTLAIIRGLPYEWEQQKLGRKDCNSATREYVYGILKELGVHNKKLPPIKELANKNPYAGITTANGIWLDSTSPLTYAHEAYHYADKHPQKGAGIFGLFAMLLLEWNVRLTKNMRAPAQIFIATVCCGIPSILFATGLFRYQEFKACKYAMTWGCTHGHEDLVKQHINDSINYFRQHPEEKKVLSTLRTSAYEYHIFEQKAYEQWKMSNNTQAYTV